MSACAWLLFYFDGFGFSAESGPRSTILKLFDAAFDIRDKGIRTFYFPGLGANFDPETAVLAKAIGGRLGSDVSQKTQDVAKDAVKEEAKDQFWEPAKKAWKQSRHSGKSIFESAEAAWSGTKEAVGKQLRNTGHAIKHTVNAPQHFVNRQIGRLRR